MSSYLAHRMAPSHRAPHPALIACVLLLAVWPAAAWGQVPAVPPERPDDPAVEPPASHAATAPASLVTFGRFASIQVNVNAAGANTVGDAANEPSIVVDPANHSHLAIGWRQFDSKGSNFRQAGVGVSTNGGLSWKAGKIDAGVFRSDPVLSIDSDGDFFYASLDGNLHAQIFPSADHGTTWGAAVAAYGGDKPWITFDRTGGPGRDHVYEAWNTSGNTYFPNTFDRSVDDGASFESPSALTGSPVFGTLDVAADGTLYVAGTSPGGIVVARSLDAQNSPGAPTFVTTTVDLGGAIRGGVPPNPEGLLGQLWIAVDRSTGPTAGWIYVLASVITPADPLDVNFIRSTDGGATWSTPVRVNDDPTGTRAYQWFGTLSVSPDGRLDAVWNDTRGSADSTHCALYYSFSTDGGTTWSANEQASPVWNSSVGYPKQNKIGDYYQMVSDPGGADLAYAATFNNEQDVYYLRLTGPTTAVETAPTPRFGMHPAQPNPFGSVMTARYEVPAGGASIALEVIDCAGRRVATLASGFRSPGAYSATWTGTDVAGRAVAPGIYLLRYTTPERVETRKTVLMR